MSLLVVGSVALDTVRTPAGQATDVVGGSAVYCAASASYFTGVNVVGVVGEDFPVSQLDFLRRRGVDLEGLETARGKTFRWSGVYGEDLNTRETLETQLNVFADFRPKVPAAYASSRDVFLANIHPELQLSVLAQVGSPRLVVCDTMNFWIERERELLAELLRRVHIVILNDEEVRQIAGRSDLIRASRDVLEMGPRTVVVKKGEHGSFMTSRDSFFALPAFPTEEVRDPTGAGDCFAGGFLGYLSSSEVIDDDACRRAMVHGSVLASFSIQAFSVQRLSTLTSDEIATRVAAYRDLTRF